MERIQRTVITNPCANLRKHKVDELEFEKWKELFHDVMLSDIVPIKIKCKVFENFMKIIRWCK